MTPEWGFGELFWPQVMRGLAMLLCIVPAVGMALNGVAAGRAALRLGPVQPDAQPGRRDRHRGGQHLAAATTRRIHVARLGEALGRTRPHAARRGGDWRRAHRARSRPTRHHAMLMAQGISWPGSSAAGPDHRLQRRVPPDGLDVPRRTGDGAAVPSPSAAATGGKGPCS